MRTFTLMRRGDDSKAAEGVEFTSGLVAIRWLSESKEVQMLNTMSDVYRIWKKTHYVKRDKDYPYKSGDFIIIGPECFSDDEGIVICWAGQNYKLVEEA